MPSGDKLLVRRSADQLGDRSRCSAPKAGMHLVVLAKGSRTVWFQERALGASLGDALSTCYLSPLPDRRLVLGYGGTTAAQMTGAVRRLRRALDAG